MQSAVSHGVAQGEHDVEVAFESDASSLVLHDSQGFETGSEENYEHVQRFLKRRRASHYFLDQILCIWYATTPPSLPVGSFALLTGTASRQIFRASRNRTGSSPNSTSAMYLLF